MRPRIDATTPGTLYLLCFDRPLGDPTNTRAMAGHYLGWTINMTRRMHLHATGRGVPITMAAVARGITWSIYHRPGTIDLEHYLKNVYKQNARLCPRCAIRRGWRPSYGFQSIDQLTMDLAVVVDDDAPLPDVPPLPMDWIEATTMREWAAMRASFVDVVDLAAVDDLL